MSARWWTLVVWALAAASALFWGLKIVVRAPAAPPQTQLAAPPALARGDLTRLLGADAPPPQAAAEPTVDARFQLIGVVAPRSQQAAPEGLALIAVDGKPPRAYRVGAVVDGQTVLQSVGARGATLGPRGGVALVALNIAPPVPASTGVMPSAAGPVAAPSPVATPGAAPGAGLPRQAQQLPPLQMPQRRPGEPTTQPTSPSQDGLQAR